MLRAFIVTLGSIAAAEDPCICSVGHHKQCCATYSAGYSCDKLGSRIAAAVANMSTPCSSGTDRHRCGYSAITRLNHSIPPGYDFVYEFERQGGETDIGHPGELHDVDQLYFGFAGTSEDSCMVAAKSRTKPRPLAMDGGRNYCNIHVLMTSAGVGGEAVDELSCYAHNKELCSASDTE